MSKLETKIETITMNQVGYRVQSLKDRQQYDEDDLAADALGISSASWPLFGVVWPSSIILASTVAQMDFDGKKVLEIGCGIAFTSIMLHSMGTDITASDYHPLASEFLKKNMHHNDLPPMHYETGNWNTANPLLGEFDVIIGSDVLYEPNHASLVSDFIDVHSGRNIQVIIVDPGRSVQSRFSRNMQSLGYSHHRERFNMMDLERKTTKGHILFYQRHS